ncbi:MAG: hypothetical protein BWY40_01230 [bacterium ADurb.Bin270]|nr:MAG: hypothetical protein BWY40_01230 [bacterium ADurb.Bin270]
MSEFKVDARDTDNANRIIKAMVNDGYVSAKAVSELTGLDQKEAKMLAESMNDDGRISSDELKMMKQSKGSERLLGISRSIGGSASDMYEAAQILRHLMNMDIVHCETKKLGSKNASYTDTDRCIYRRVRTNREEINAAIEMMFENFARRTSLPELRMFAEQFNFGLLSDSQKSELSTFLAEKIRLERGRLEPIHTYIVATILSSGLGASGRKALTETKRSIDRIHKQFVDEYGNEYHDLIKQVDKLCEMAEFRRKFDNLKSYQSGRYELKRKNKKLATLIFSDR